MEEIAKEFNQLSSFALQAKFKMRIANSQSPPSFKMRERLFHIAVNNCVSLIPATSATSARKPRPACDIFKGKFVELYADFSNATVAQASLTRQMMQTINLGVHSGMTFEEGIFVIIRSLMYPDGMVLRCKPDAVLLRDMRRFIGEFEKMV